MFSFVSSFAVIKMQQSCIFVEKKMEKKKEKDCAFDNFNENITFYFYFLYFEYCYGEIQVLIFKVRPNFIKSY